MTKFVVGSKQRAKPQGSKTTVLLIVSAWAVCLSEATTKHDAVKTVVHDALAAAGIADVAGVFHPALDHKVELILPGTACPTPTEACPECVGSGRNDACVPLQPEEGSELRQRALRVLSEAFGGARCAGAADVGAWVDGTGALVVEDATVCTSSVSLSSLETQLPRVFAFARDVGRDLGQDLMAVSVDGGLLLLPPSPAVDGPDEDAPPTVLPPSVVAHAGEL
eukprot:m.464016 g.464016  ORF g.464016 m.464016 type:complete len:223 (+) comp23278_c0_seq1:104-772(+)